MSANSRWPDISRVSSLFNPFGSKGAASDEASNPEQNHQNNVQEQPESKAAVGNEAPTRNGTAFEMMTDIDGQPIDGMGGFDENYANDAHGDMEADFPPLEMFDSNAAEVPFSSLNAASFDSNNQAPTASMSIEEPSATKKSKKDKKKKKKGEEPHEEGAHKRAKRQSIGEDDVPLTSQEAPAGSIELGEEPHTSAQQSKRKRKSSDGAESKRKKRKSHAAPEVVEEAVEDEHAADFLRKDPKSGPAQLALAVEEDATGESDPQRSPTVAHLRRRSQSRSREPSAAAPDQLDTQDVADVARQAWDEHINGGENKNQTEDAPMPDATEENTPHEENTPAKRKSTRKKAKPTFFDQPPPEDALPSPAAMTPKPRKRAKPATKKEKAPPKRAHSMMGGDEDGYEEADRPKRKNRMEGYTKGRFTDEEMERMGKQIKDFAHENDLTPYQVNEMIHEPGGTQAGEAHSQLWSRLFAECPDRHRQKVINIIRKKYHNFVARGTWTPEQDAEFRTLIDVHGATWSKIGKILNRHPEDLRDRYRNYIVCGDRQKKDAWTEEEEGELANHIVESMKTIDELRAMQPGRQMLLKSYEELIDWQNISELMGRTRSRLQCITKWKSMNLKTHGKDKFESLQPDSQISFELEKARRQLSDMPAAERYRMILAITGSAVSTDNKIPWSKLCDRAWRLEWNRKTLILLWHRLKKTVAGWERMTTRDIGQQLVDTYDHTDQLPDVDKDNYDDLEEMQVLKTLGASQARAEPRKKTKSSQAISDEKVTGSDMEDDEQEQQATQGEELQIDPALVQAAEATTAAEAALAAQDSAAANGEAAPADVETDFLLGANKTPGKKTATYGKKRGSAKKTSNVLSQDPIEDSTTDPSQELPQMPAQDTQEEVKDPAPKRQRGTKGKGAKGRKRFAKSAETVQGGASSDMDDGMEDLPATVEEAAE